MATRCSSQSRARGRLLRLRRRPNLILTEKHRRCSSQKSELAVVRIDTIHHFILKAPSMNKGN